MQERKYEILLVLVLVFLFAFFFNKELLSSAICAKTITQPNDYTSGNIIVVFRNDVNPNDAVSTIKSYGLETEIFSKWDSFLDVKVPQGKETKWICKLSSNNNIKHAIYKISFS
jgi:hypothetical protein|tara:strand:+ start:440 stop:781 length:342 start_codon:yes stop_codon:yes gene_type:complete